MSKLVIDQFDALYQNLNEQQKQAVSAVDGPVMVIAGAGTGKTQILAMRIANILRNPDLHMNPQNILCLTFTESAVTAMRRRLVKIIGSAAYYVRIHTFHSFCNEVIKEHPERFLFSPQFQKAAHLDLSSNDRAPDFISELEQIEIMNEIIDSLPGTSLIKPYGEPYFYRSDLINNIKTLKREAINPQDLLAVVENLEGFLGCAQNHIEEFISRHARSIKDEDCDLFLEKLNVLCYDFNQYLKLFSEFYKQSEKISEFKNKIKDFYEKNLKAIPKQKDLVTVYEKYNETLARRRLYDFEDMILWVTEAFKQDKDLLAKYQEQYQYILVDEYQDTNGAQNLILDLITEFHGERANIFVVGDDDQSIYRFQGASVENIVYFYRRFKKTAKFVVLEDNYRSTQEILDASHSLIKCNESRISNIIPEINKKLSARTNHSEGPIEIHELETNKDEMFFVAQKIQEQIKSGTQPKDIAILYRTNKDVYDLIDIFSRLDIPFKVEAGNDILKNIDIIHLLDLFKIIENPYNDSLLFNVLNYNFLVDADGKSFCTKEIFEVTRLKSKRNNPSTDETSKINIKSNDISTSKTSENINNKHLIDILLEHNSFKNFAEQVFKWKQSSFNLSLDALFELVIKESNYLNHIMRKPNKIELLNRLNTLFDEIKLLSRSNNKKQKNSSTLKSTFTLKDFLNHINLLQDNNLAIKEHSLKTNANAVNLMTAHRSKGLEFDYVFIVKSLDKNWGNRRELSKLRLPAGLIKETESFTTNDNNEDERRLFYVALTRARKQAFITYSKTNEKGKSTVPSIFVEEIEKTLTNKIDAEAHTHSELKEFEMIFQDKSIQDSLAEQKEFINKILEDYKLSVTHLNNYLKCPRLFFYKNLIRVPSAKNKHASFGTAVHTALYDLFSRLKNPNNAILQNTKSPDFDPTMAYKKSSNKLQANNLPSPNINKNYLIERFEYHLSEESLSETEFKDSLEFGKETLSKYYEEYQNQFITNSLLEFDFTKMGIAYNDMTLTGKLDKIEILSEKDKTINVVDYKTGNPSNKGPELKPGGEYHRQVTFYKYLCDEANKSKQFPYAMHSGEIDFIQSDNDGKFSKKRLFISDDDIKTLKEEIGLIQAGIKEQNFSKTDDLSHCESCAFKTLCWK